MKRIPILLGLSLLLVCLALSWNGAAGSPARQATPRPGPQVTVSITGLTLDQKRSVYTLSLSVANPQLVSRLIVSVEESEGGTIATGSEVNLAGKATARTEIDGAKLRGGMKYLITVKAVDFQGFYIERQGETVSAPGEKIVLAQKEFTYPLPPTAAPQQILIQSVTTDWSDKEMQIALDVPNNIQFIKYEGFFVDDAGQRVGNVGPDLYPGETLVVPLPAAMQELKEAHEYNLAISLTAKDDTRTQAGYKFKLGPTPQPGFFRKITNALANQPYIALAIVVVGAIGATILVLGQRKPHDPMWVRPPVDISEDIGRRARERKKAPTPLPPPPPPEPVRPPTRAVLRVKIIESPGVRAGTEKVITTFPCTVGRQDEVLSFPEDKKISRRHAQILVQDGQFYIMDLKSLNGTFVGDRQLSPMLPTQITGPVDVRFGSQTCCRLEPQT